MNYQIFCFISLQRSGESTDNPKSDRYSKNTYTDVKNKDKALNIGSKTEMAIMKPHTSADNSDVVIIDSDSSQNTQSSQESQPKSSQVPSTKTLNSCVGVNSGSDTVSKELLAQIDLEIEKSLKNVLGWNSFTLEPKPNVQNQFQSNRPNILRKKTSSSKRVIDLDHLEDCKSASDSELSVINPNKKRKFGENSLQTFLNKDKGLSNLVSGTKGKTETYTISESKTDPLSKSETVSLSKALASPVTNISSVPSSKSTDAWLSKVTAGLLSKPSVVTPSKSTAAASSKAAVSKPTGASKLTGATHSQSTDVKYSDHTAVESSESKTIDSITDKPADSMAVQEDRLEGEFMFIVIIYIF